MDNVSKTCSNGNKINNFFYFLKELKGKIEACSRTAEDFTKLYYQSFDKRRHVSFPLTKS